MVLGLRLPVAQDAGLRGQLSGPALEEPRHSQSPEESLRCTHLLWTADMRVTRKNLKNVSSITLLSSQYVKIGGVILLII